MNVYRELTLTGGPEDLQRFFAEVKASADGWERDREQETNLGMEYVAFRKPETPHSPAAVLYLYGEPRAGDYHVANVLPRDKTELSLQEYNQIVQSFYQSCVQPFEAAYRLKITLTSADADFAGTLGPRTFEMLKRFSSLANKSTGASHPLDRQRWLEFIAASIKNHDDIDTELLFQWLVEEEQWAPQEASRLSREYGLAVDLQSLVAA